MRNKIGIASSLLAALFGVLLIIFGTRTQVAVFIDGQPRTFYTHAITVGNALAAGGIPVTASDRVSPAVGSFLPKSGIISIDRTHSMQVVVEPGGTNLAVQSADRIPGNLLLKAGILLFPDDRVLFNGKVLDPTETLPYSTVYTLQFRRAQPVAVHAGGQTSIFYSSAFTLGQALNEAGFQPGLKDAVSVDLDSALTGGVEVDLKPARLVVVTANGKTLSFYSGAETVGGALADAGISLQYLDMAVPPEGDALPADGKITIKSVRETLSFQKITTQYGTDYITDPNTELDQTSIVKAGQVGLSISRLRVQTVNGSEVGRVTDAAWQVSQPVNEQIGTGTKIVIRSLDTPYGTIQYWRTKTVYVTSYAPCPYGTSPCLYGSSSGMPVQYGLIATYLNWYKAMKYQQLYVPGYGIGTIGDVGRYPDGRPWIDVAYSNESYIPWGSYVTVYFLTPVPSWYPQVLQ